MIYEVPGMETFYHSTKKLYFQVVQVVIKNMHFQFIPIKAASSSKFWLVFLNAADAMISAHRPIRTFQSRKAVPFVSPWPILLVGLDTHGFPLVAHADYHANRVGVGVANFG